MAHILRIIQEVTCPRCEEEFFGSKESVDEIYKEGSEITCPYCTRGFEATDDNVETWVEFDSEEIDGRPVTDWDIKPDLRALTIYLQGDEERKIDF